jgi:hypothetical protein
MSGHRVPRHVPRRVTRRVTAFLAGCALLSVSLLTGCSDRAEPAVNSFSVAGTYVPVAPPVRVRIPAAQVDSTLERLSRTADGAVQLPSRWNVAGWYAEGARPGQAGPAVIVGHVDSTSGPAVFFHLSTLGPGDAIHVDRADRSTITFHVTSVMRVRASRFPTDLVYGPTLQPSLRLLTCGGIFDSATKQYQDNVIVFADPA